MHVEMLLCYSHVQIDLYIIPKRTHMPCFRNVYMKTGVKGLSSTMVIVMQALKALTQKDVQTNTNKSLITKAETFSIHKNKAKITDALSIYICSRLHV